MVARVIKYLNAEFLGEVPGSLLSMTHIAWSMRQEVLAIRKSKKTIERVIQEKPRVESCSKKTWAVVAFVIADEQPVD